MPQFAQPWFRCAIIFHIVLLMIGVSGCKGSSGSQGAAGPQGVPGPVNTTAPPAPANLRLFADPAGPPSFDLRWSFPPSPVAIEFFVVYASGGPITLPSSDSVVASAPGAARQAAVRLAANSGARRFRVSAVSFTGVEGPLSEEYIVDTTARLLFLADKTIDTVTDLYSVLPGSGAEPKNLSALHAPASVQDSAPSPDGRRVAFTADKDAAGVFELYVAPADGGSAPLKVSGALVAGGEVAAFAWSPDGGRIAFIADKETDNVEELYVAPADGATPPVKVSGALVSGGSVNTAPAPALGWSSDGERIAFVAAKRTAGLNELFVAPASGAAEPVPISGQIVSGGNVVQFLWAPDGNRIAFQGALVTQGVEELFVAAADGSGPPTAISGAPIAAAGINGFAWSPDGGRLAFSSDRRVDGTFEMFVTSAAGEAGAIPEPIPLAATVSPFSDIGAFAWSPDSRYVAFTADRETDNTAELYVAPAAGGTDAVKVSGALVANGAVSPFDIGWSPDSQRLAFIADKRIDFKNELFVVGRDGGAEPVAVSGTLGANADVGAFAWSPEGDRLAMVADKTTDNLFELYIALATGGVEPVAVSGAMGPNADVSFLGLTWTPLGAP